MVKCALVCITKNEKMYIREYIDYYLKLGFHRIFLYDNSPNFELRNFHNVRKVVVIHFPGEVKQIPAYNHFLKKFKSIYDYVAFFDTDEFLVLKKHRNISDFCKHMVPSGAIGINWYFYGNNGHEHYSPEFVTKRFTKRENRMNPNVKTIAKCSDISSMLVHHPILNNGSFRNCKGNSFEGPFNYDFDDSMAQLNHYWCRSTEEAMWKIQRGRSDTHEKRPLESMYGYLGLNHVEDEQAVRFFLDIPPPFAIALVVYIENVGQKEKFIILDKNFNEIIFYSSPENNFTDTVISTKEEFCNHFLTYNKNSFSHVLFLEGIDTLETNISISLFCKNNLQGGAVILSSPTKQGKRILGKCQDLLDVRKHQIFSLGFGEKIRETTEIIFN